MSPSAERHPSRAPRPRNAEAGFTILETVIALFVALVVGFGAIGLFLFSASFNAGASDRARALAIAQETMEELRAKSFTDSTLAAGTTTTPVTRGSSAADEADLRSFTVVKKVENISTTNPADREKKITVTVTPVALEGRFSPGGVTLLMVRTSDTIGTN
jgi:Tfp pilus assembly protein PilV